MTSRQAVRFFILATGVLLVIFFLVAQFTSPLNLKFANDVAILTVITVGAVAIERIIEAFWTFVGLTKGAWWPLAEVTTQIEEKVNGMDALLKPVYSETEKAIDKLAAANNWTQNQIQASKDELVALQQNINWIKSLAPDSQRVQLIAAQAFQNVNYLVKKYPDIYTTASAVSQAVIGITDFMATFKDNPGRRLISIYAGMLIGLLVAGIAGLDVFQATLGSSPSTGLHGFLPFLGVALTGVVIGLGASPTHEVIRTLQEMKSGRKLDNTPMPQDGQSAFATFQLRRK